jgi:hypothetical protein
MNKEKTGVSPLRTIAQYNTNSQHNRAEKSNRETEGLERREKKTQTPWPDALDDRTEVRPLRARWIPGQEVRKKTGSYRHRLGASLEPSHCCRTEERDGGHEIRQKPNKRILGRTRPERGAAMNWIRTWHPWHTQKNTARRTDLTGLGSKKSQNTCPSRNKIYWTSFQFVNSSTQNTFLPT